jgi:mannosyl-oligosaccharide alpha-1,2-mannosidase
MTLHGWNGYKKHAWGSNELKPISKRQHNADIFGHTPHLGATIIDSMDTLYIMGLKKEFEEAANWVRDSFNIEIDTNLSLFEVNIRIIGGLLSAFTLSQKRVGC